MYRSRFGVALPGFAIWSGVALPMMASAHPFILRGCFEIASMLVRLDRIVAIARSRCKRSHWWAVS